jgi:hypothetical protein
MQGGDHGRDVDTTRLMRCGSGCVHTAYMMDYIAAQSRLGRYVSMIGSVARLSKA